MSLIIYTKTGCWWCVDALDYLNTKGIQYEEREVWSNPEFMKELEEKSGQTKAPTLDLDGEILADAGVEDIDVFLKEKGVVRG
jgi:glutaredoxin 3